MEPFENDESIPVSNDDVDPTDTALDDTTDDTTTSDPMEARGQDDEEEYDDEEVDDGEYDDEEVDDGEYEDDEEVDDGEYEDEVDDEEEYDDEEVDDEAEDDEVERPRKEASGPRDPRIDKAFDFLHLILQQMGMNVSVRRRRPRPESSPDEIHLEIMGHDVGRVIGKKGQVLTALQYLVNRVANRPGLPRRHVVLDAEGYRYRRETTLASLAKRLGEQAVKEGKIITFEPMSPRDRRVVHLALAKFPNVVTKSDGEGDERRVRIIPVRR